MDDVGASSKRYEVYSHSLKGVGNWLFLKYIPPFKKWGPYRELNVKDWLQIFHLLRASKAKMTVGVTASWAEDETRLIPFPKKFPEEAKVLKKGVQEGLIEIANHGLTHCVVEKNAFKPKWFSSNRKYHREFWEWVSADIQKEHLRRSQDILQTYFDCRVVTLIPPGNVFVQQTLDLAHEHGLQFLSCMGEAPAGSKLKFISNKHVVPFHDRDLVVHGIGWLSKKINEHQNTEFQFVRDLGGYS
jgi:peptidoglycan/xylan/chitin deacetylase (PgdA/CDA1 family)